VLTAYVPSSEVIDAPAGDYTSVAANEFRRKLVLAWQPLLPPAPLPEEHFQGVIIPNQYTEGYRNSAFVPMSLLA